MTPKLRPLARRNVIGRLALSALVAAWSAIGGVGRLGAQPPAGPNVLWIYVDDLNTDVGAWGHPVVQTPNMDALAQRAVRFEYAYAPSPVCNPSRVSTMTGKRPLNAEHFLNEDVMLDRELGGTPTLPWRFRLEGYSVLGAGKIFHGVGGRSFVEPRTWHEYIDRNDDPWIDKPDNPVPEDGFRVVYWGPFENGVDGSLGKMRDTHNTDAVLENLERLAGHPFFLAVGFQAPHSPFIYPERFHGLYDPATDVAQLPPEEQTDWRKQVPWAMYSSANYLDPKWDHDPDAGRREATVAYWRTITYVDEQIGRILEKLDALGLREQTIVVVVGDHGWSNGHHGRYGKSRPYEWSVRTPLIVSVPWMTPTHGRTSPRPVELIHLYPTLMELCSLETPTGLDGQSFVPLLADPDASFPPAFSLYASGWGLHVQHIVRSDRYKFVWWDTGRHVLFDLQNDPGEYTNLFGDPAYDAIGQVHVQYLVDAGMIEPRCNRYGVGLAGARGVPNLQCDSLPAIGNNVVVQIANSSGVESFGMLTFGIRGAREDLAGGTVYGGPTIVTPVTIPATGASSLLPLPPEPVLIGRSVAIQCVQADAAAAQGLAFSRPLRVYIGDATR